MIIDNRCHALGSILLCVSLAACGASTNGNERAEVFEEDGRLWVAAGTGSKTLVADDSQGYHAMLSPDGRHMVVDVAMLSNLNVSTLLSRGEAGGAYDIRRNLSAAAWQQAREEYGVDVEALHNPRTRCVAWIKSHSIVVEVSGLADDGGEFRESVTLVADYLIDDVAGRGAPAPAGTGKSTP